MFHVIIPTDHGVFLICEGDFSLAEVTEAWREVREMLPGMDRKRVFVNITRLRTIPGTAELFDLAKLLWLGFPQVGRIALVARWDQSRVAKLLEILIRSVGTYLTAFVSAEQAGAWLLEKERGKTTGERILQMKTLLLNE